MKGGKGFWCKTDLLLVNDTFLTIPKKLSGGEPFLPKNFNFFVPF
jgi:hypothetical protein